MDKGKINQSIEQIFRKKVKKDPLLKNAYLLVHSDRSDIHLNLAEGETNGKPAHPNQPNYMASVGKLFTSTIIAMLAEQGKLSFDASITKYLDTELTQNLHIFKGSDYSDKIQVRHLLNQSSGLPDNFWPLLYQLLENPDFSMTPREAILWAKENSHPKFPPGEGCNYTDTNYHLLGLIAESVTGKPFYETLHSLIFDPLDMKHSYMLNYSEPLENPSHPESGFYLTLRSRSTNSHLKEHNANRSFFRRQPKQQIRLNDYRGFAGLDYTGGGVTGPAEDMLKFMKALVNHQLVSENTLMQMKNDRVRLGMGPGVQYGYGIWQIVTIPFILPKKFNSWGVLGATGAFMFYHSELNAYLIGTFNDSAYERKSVRFMMQIMNQLWKLE